MRTNYKQIFLRSNQRSANYVIQRRRQSAEILSPKDQGQVFHCLIYILKFDESWPTARELLLIAAPDMEQAGHRAQWIERINKGIERSHGLKDLMSKAWLHIYLGELYQYQADYHKARREFEESITFFSKENKVQEHARALNSLANVFRSERNFLKATELVNEALQIAGHFKETVLHSSLVRAVIGIDTYDWQTANYFAQKSLALAQELDDQRMEAWSLNNLLGASWGLKEYQFAMMYYEEAIRLFKIITDPVHEGLTKMNMGLVYVELNELQTALKLYLAAESIFRQTQDPAYVAMLNNNMGMVYHQLQQWAKAEEAYKISINQWKNVGNMISVVNTMDNLGLLYLAQKFYDRAIEIFSEALRLLEQIKHDPNYDFFFNMVSESLRSAKEQKDY